MAGGAGSQPVVRRGHKATVAQLADGEGVEAQPLVPAQQAVAAALGEVEAGTAGDDGGQVRRVAVVQALEPALPAGVLVQLVQHDGAEVTAFEESAGEDGLTVGGDVPIEVKAAGVPQPCLGERGLPNLAGAGQEHELRRHELADRIEEIAHGVGPSPKLEESHDFFQVALKAKAGAPVSESVHLGRLQELTSAP